MDSQVEFVDGTRFSSKTKYFIGKFTCNDLHGIAMISSIDGQVLNSRFCNWLQISFPKSLRGACRVARLGASSLDGAQKIN